MERAAHVTRAINFIERNLRNELSVDDIANAVGYSTSRFHSLFAGVTGWTVGEYVRIRRLACAALALAFSEQRIIDIALEYRFESQEAFTRAFKRLYGVTPGAFRREPEYTSIVTRFGVHRTMAEMRRRILCGEPLGPACGLDADIPNPRARRKVLPEVSHIGFYSGEDRCPEDIAFPSCLAATLRYLGEDYPWIPVHMHRADWRLNGAFVEMMAASGMAFSLLWREGWHQDNADLMFIADPRDVIKHAFNYAGYRYEFIRKRGEGTDEARMRARIVSSIDAGRPALAFGVIGPPECCLITGYDSGGEILIGWNYFQNESSGAELVEFEPNGYFRKKDWFESTIGVVIIGDKEIRSHRQERLRWTLQWGIALATTSRVYDRHSGMAAYDAWAAQLLDDLSFRTNDVDLLRQRHQVHEVAVNNVAECRWYANMFLREMAHAVPSMKKDLLAAAAEYDQEHTLMWRAWDVLGGNGHPQAHLRLSDPESRRRLVSIIRAARECDGHAIDYLESALRK